MEDGQDVIQREVKHVLYFVYAVVQVAIAFLMLAAMSPNLSFGEFCALLIITVISALKFFGE